MSVERRVKVERKSLRGSCRMMVRRKVEKKRSLGRGMRDQNVGVGVRCYGICYLDIRC